MNRIYKLLSDWKSSIMGMGATLALPWIADFTFRKYYEEPEADHELHQVETPDGVNIALWHYLPRGPEPHEPVLLVHGLGANHRNLALNEKNGVAQYLAERGYDCWAIDLRGRGGSDVPDGSWDFDQYSQLDLPTAIDYILDQTDFPKLHWVGHSMGGMLFYAVGGSMGYHDRIASAVTLASPFGMQEPLSVNKFAVFINKLITNFWSLPLLRKMRFEVKDLPNHMHRFPLPLRSVPQSFLARWGAFFLLPMKEYLPEDLVLAYMNPKTIDDDTIKAGVNAIVEGVSSGELLQFGDWVLNDRWTNKEQTIDYAEGVQNLDVPTLMFAGNADRMTPPHHLKWGFNKLPTTDKKFILAGTDYGFEHDYSHVDLVLGKRAREEIFPEILKWIQTHPIQN